MLKKLVTVYHKACTLIWGKFNMPDLLSSSLVMASEESYALSKLKLSAVEPNTWSHMCSLRDDYIV